MAKGPFRDRNLSVEGHHLGDRPFFADNIMVDVSCSADGANIRLDDCQNLAWWLQIHLSKNQLEVMLEKINRIA